MNTNSKSKTTTAAMNLPLINPSRNNAARAASLAYGFPNPDYQDLNKKIYYAFAGTKSFPFERIIFQFWLPVTDDTGRLVLESSGSPFAYPVYYLPLRIIYRWLSLNYKYSTDDNPNSNPPWIISDGPVTTAFRNHFPEVVLDLRAHKGSSPFVDGALDCDLACCVMIPVFHHDSSECIGVVECSMKHPGLLLPIFNEMKHQLEKQGMSIYHVQGSWPYSKTITTGDLEAVKIEIDNGLKMACESHDLTLAQVWISYTQMERTLLVKLSGYSIESHDDDPIKDFYDKFDVISGEGLAWKTHGTHQPHLCRNIYKLSDNRGILALISANANANCTCLVVCLRSTHTGELDYAFEFFWPCNRNHLILLKTLFWTLNKYLPSFRFASGEQLGDDVTSVVDVKNLSSDETRTYVGVKRKSISGCEEKPPLNNINNLNDVDDVAILAAYRNEASLFYLPSSSPYEVVMEKLNKEFELDPARTHKIDYEIYPGRWCSLVCLKSCRRTEDMGVVKLRVWPEGREVGWKWKTNTYCEAKT